MNMISKHCFEVRTELRTYQFILNTDSPLDEYLQVLSGTFNHFENIKKQAEEKAKESSQAEQPIKE